MTSTARRPSAATEWIGWKLRTAPGRRRSVSVIAPTVEGLRWWSYQDPKGPTRSRRVNVGTTTVPAGPTASRKPSITASAPPTTYPRLRRELWKKTVSPAPSPSRPSPAATPARVTVLRAPDAESSPLPLAISPFPDRLPGRSGPGAGAPARSCCAPYAPAFRSSSSSTWARCWMPARPSRTLTFWAKMSASPGVSVSLTIFW